MTTEETYNEVTVTVGDDLRWMAQKLQAKWPTLEPEMLLINWLCYRNGINPPSQPILKRPLKPQPPFVGSGVKTTWVEELQLRPLLPEVTAAVGIVGRSTAPSTPTPRAPSSLGRSSGGMRPVSAMRPGSAARSMRPLTASDGRGCRPPPPLETKSPEPPRAATPSTQASGFSSPDIKSPEPPTPVEQTQLRFVDALAAAEAKLPEPGPRCASALSKYEHLGATFTLPRPEPVDPSLKTLTGLCRSADRDSERQFGCSDVIYKRNCAMEDSAMDRRQDRWQAFLSGCPLFSLDVVSHEEQRALARSLRTTTFGRHDCILAEGEIGQRVIFVERGECDVVQAGDIIDQPGPGSFFGEASIIFDAPSKVALVAASEVTALWLNREDVAAVVKGGGLFRMKTAARARLCAGVPLLAELTVCQQARIAAKLRSERWRRGSTVVGAMHASPRLFIVEEGECKLVDQDHRDLLTSSMRSMERSQRLQASLLKPGQHFGMEGLLVGCHVLANSEEVKTLSISYEEILETCDPDERTEVATQMHSSMQVFLLRQVPQLRNLSNESFSAVRSQVEEVLFRPWTPVIPRGALLDTVFVLKSGKVAEHDGDMLGLQDLSKLQVNRPESVTPGECFWPAGLVDAQAKAKTTVVALTPASMLKIQRKAVSAVLHDICEKLDKIPPFQLAALSEPDKISLATQLRAWHFAPNRTVAVEGELGERLFIVESGVCDLVKVVNGKETILGQLGRGAYFGELSIFFDEPRKVTVRSVTEVTLLTMKREDLSLALPAAKLERVQAAALSLCLRSIPLLSRLDSNLRLLVAQRFRTQTWKAGDVLQRRLLPCHQLHFVESGTCLATQGDTAMCSRLVHLLGENELPVSCRRDQDAVMLLGPGQYFGMRGFLTGASLGFAVTAESLSVRTSSISYEDLVNAAGPQRKQDLERKLREALRVHFLRQLPPLKDLDGEEVLKLVRDHCQELRYAQGEVIVAKGAPLDAFILLESGKLVEHTVAPEEVRHMWWEGTEHSSPGACFPPGAHYQEVSSGGRASAFTLLAESPCSVLWVPIESLRPARLKAE